jgi:precorrin-6A/cobalt-precorrin-6A reductase
MVSWQFLRNIGQMSFVTKDSGGQYTWPKMLAAEQRGIPVVVVRRPTVTAGVPVVSGVEDALAWVRAPR